MSDDPTRIDDEASSAEEDRLENLIQIKGETFDLSLLDKQERQTLEDSQKKSGRAWKYGIAYPCLYLFIYLKWSFQTGDWAPPGDVQMQIGLMILKFCGYIAFALWARKGSPAAHYLLLGWHLFTSYEILLKGSLLHKGIFVLVALVIFLGGMFATSLRAAKRKAKVD